MASTAARTAGWQQRLGAKAGPLGPVSAGSGESFAGTAVEVELFIDGQWVPITARVMVRDSAGVIGITRGRPNEGSKTLPGVCSMQINNRDGLFSPRNATSPYYGKIGRNTQIRVSVPLGNGKNYRFWGEVPAWPVNWDTTGTDVWVQLEAAGVLRRLGQGNAPIGSAMYVSVAFGETTYPVVAYWPCEDPVGSASIGSAVSGVPAMTIAGVPVLATNTDFECSTALPKMGTASFTGSVPAYTTPLPAPSEFVTMLRFLLEIPQAGATNGQVVAALTWTGSIPRWEVYYSTSGGGQLGLRGRDATGTVVQDTGLGGPALNGVKVHVSAELQESGGIAFVSTLNIIVDGAVTASGPTTFTLGPVAGLVTSVAVAPGRGLTDTVVGHVRVQTAPNNPTDTAQLGAVLAAHAGETAADRLSRLCAVAGVGFELVGSASDSAAMGVQSSATLISLIDDAVEVDGGLLFESTGQLGLGYRTRVALENQAPALALSYPAFNLAEIPVPVDDDRYTRNDITVSRQNGSKARATQTDGPLSVAAPPAGVGRYDEQVTVNVESDADLPDQAGWRLHLGTVDEARFPRLAVNLAHPSFAQVPALRAAALGVRPGDRVTVSGMPAFGQTDDVSQLAQGSSETVNNFQHRIAWNNSPESPYRVAVTDSAVFGRVDTDGSSLAVGVGPVDTSLLVQVTDGPLWTTDPAEVPFDARLGGEVVTVTAVAGSSSPQTFTVTRSVNGVVKAQVAGADVRLAQPAVAAL